MTVRTCLTIVIALCLSASTSRAQQPGSGEFVVDGAHAVIDVPMHTEFAAFFFLESRVRHAFSVDPDLFKVEVLTNLKVKHANERSVFVKPSSKLLAEAWGNVVILTEEQMLSVRVCMVKKPADALIHVVIRKPPEQAAIAPVFATSRSIDGKSCQSQPPSQRRHPTIAKLLLNRSDAIPVNRSARRGDVIVRVERGQWIGRRYFLLFEVENSGKTEFRVADARVTSKARKSNLAGNVQLSSPNAPPGLLAVVPAGEQRRGIVEIVGAAKLNGAPVTFSLSERHGKRQVSVSRIALSAATSRRR